MTIRKAIALLTAAFAMMLVIISVEDGVDQSHVLAEVSPVQQNTGMHEKMMNLKSNIVQAKAYALLVQGVQGVQGVKGNKPLLVKGITPPEDSQIEAEHSILTTMLTRLAHDPQATNVMGEYAAIIGRMKGEIRAPGYPYNKASNLLLQMNVAIKEGHGIVVSDGKGGVKLGWVHHNSPQYGFAVVTRASFNAMAIKVGKLNAHSSHLEALAGKARLHEAQTLMQRAKSKTKAIITSARDKVTALLSHEDIANNVPPHPTAQTKHQELVETHSKQGQPIRMSFKQWQQKAARLAKKQGTNKPNKGTDKGSMRKPRSANHHVDKKLDKTYQVDKKLDKKLDKTPVAGVEKADEGVVATDVPQESAEEKLSRDINPYLAAADEIVATTASQDSPEERLPRYLTDTEEENENVAAWEYETGSKTPETPEQFLTDHDQLTQRPVQLLETESFNEKQEAPQQEPAVNVQNGAASNVPEVYQTAGKPKALTRAQIVAYANKISKMKAQKAEEARATTKAQEAVLAQAEQKEQNQESQATFRPKEALNKAPPIALDAQANSILTSLLSRSERGTQILNGRMHAHMDKQAMEDPKAQQVASEIRKEDETETTKKAHLQAIGNSPRPDELKQYVESAMKQPTNAIDFFEFEKEFNRQAAKVLLEEDQSDALGPKKRVALPYRADTGEDANEDADDLVTQELWADTMRSKTAITSTHPFRKYAPKFFEPHQNLESQLSKLTSGPHGDEQLKDIMRAGKGPMDAFAEEDLFGNAW